MRSSPSSSWCGTHFFGDIRCRQRQLWVAWIEPHDYMASMRESFMKFRTLDSHRVSSPRCAPNERARHRIKARCWYVELEKLSVCCIGKTRVYYTAYGLYSTTQLWFHFSVFLPFFNQRATLWTLVNLSSKQHRHQLRLRIFYSLHNVRRSIKYTGEMRGAPIYERFHWIQKQWRICGRTVTHELREAYEVVCVVYGLSKHKLTHYLQS